MAKTEHTLGPWKIKNIGNVYTSTGPAINAGTKRIARVKGNGEEDYANAKLIAAAPDLLTALAQMLATLKVYADYWQNDQVQYGDILDDMDKARAVIAKATE